MPRRILDFVEMPRYKLAYFFFLYGKTRDNVSKAEIARIFGYASPGHFYPDINYLLKEGIIREVDNHYELGREGKIEFRFLTLPLLMLLFSIAFTLIFIFLFIMNYYGMSITPFVYPYMSIYTIFNAIICYRTLKTFSPDLPSEVKTLKPRGWMTRIKELLSRK